MKKLLSIAATIVLATAFAMPLNAAPMFVPQPEQVRSDLVENVSHKWHRYYRHWRGDRSWRSCRHYGSCYPRRYYGYRSFYPRYYRPYYPRPGISLRLSF